jgi:RimJ/RimL family protein N-acetyltransferase
MIGRMTSIWTGRAVRLRAIEPDDWPAFQRFEEHSADMRHAGMIHPPRSTAGMRQWAQERATEEPKNDLFWLAIESLEERVVVGSMSTGNVDYRTGRFNYGIAIGHDHQRRGYASDAIVLLLGYMFGERRFHKCEAQVYAFNEASIGLHGKMGFQVEGRLRDHEFFAGRHHDLVIMGQTAEEFTTRHGLPSI